MIATQAGKKPDDTRCVTVFQLSGLTYNSLLHLHGRSSGHVRVLHASRHSIRFEADVEGPYSESALLRILNLAQIKLLESIESGHFRINISRPELKSESVRSGKFFRCQGLQSQIETG